MGFRRMEMINRAAIIVKPAQPFLDWLHRVDSTSAHLRLEDLQREPTIYLVPEYDREDEALEFLSQKAEEIFEEHLDGCIGYRRLGQRRAICRHSGAGLNLAFIPWSWIFAMSQLSTKKCNETRRLPRSQKILTKAHL